MSPLQSTGHNSVVMTVEMQMDWVVNCLLERRKRNAKSVAVKTSTVDNYMNELRDQLKGMVWDAASCSPWYTDELGRNVSMYVFRFNFALPCRTRQGLLFSRRCIFYFGHFSFQIPLDPYIILEESQGFRLQPARIRVEEKVAPLCYYERRILFLRQLQWTMHKCAHALDIW